MRSRTLITGLVAIGSIFLLGRVQAQDVHFSQFYMAPLQQNPALAGAEHDLEAIINYKDQWASVATPYKTLGASFDMRLTKPSTTSTGYWAMGVNFYSDKAGDAQMGTTQGNLTLAYHVITSQYSSLGAGIMGGYAQRSINYSALTWGNQYDGTQFNASLPTGEPTTASNSVSYMDGAAGVNWVYDNTSGNIDVTDNHALRADVGFAMFHVNRPKYSFYGTGEKLDIRYSFFGNSLISLSNSRLAVGPGLMYYKQSGANELYLGSQLRFKLKQDSKYTGLIKSAALSLGCYYRMKDAVVATMLLQEANYSLGVSYDINVSQLKNASKSMGGIELALRYVFPSPFRGKKMSGSHSNVRFM